MNKELALHVLEELLKENIKLREDKLKQYDNLVRITGSYKDVSLWVNFSETNDRVLALEKAIDAFKLCDF